MNYLYAKNMYMFKDRKRVSDLNKIIKNEMNDKIQRSEAELELSKIHSVWGYTFSYYDAQGKRIWKTEYGDGKWNAGEAEKAGATLKQSLKPKISNVKKMTFSELFEKYVEMKKNDEMKPRCLYDLRKVVDRHINYKLITDVNNKKKLVPYFRDMELPNITSEEIEKWQDILRSETYETGKKGNKETKSYAKRQLSKIESNFNAILEFGVKRKYLSENPYKSLDFIKRTALPDVHALITEEQFDSLIAVVENSEKDELKRLQKIAIFTILGLTGIRKGELISTSISSYDAETHSLNIDSNFDYVNNNMKRTPPKTKNGYRKIPLCAQAETAIVNLIDYYKKIKGYNPNTDYFLVSFDKPLSSTTLTNWKDKYLIAANIPHIKLHDFRHSHTTVLIDNGATAADVAARIGDTIGTVNSVYAHSFDEKQKEIAKQQDERLKERINRRMSLQNK